MSILFWIVVGFVSVSYLGVSYMSMRNTIQLYKSFDRRITALEEGKKDVR